MANDFQGAIYDQNILLNIAEKFRVDRVKKGLCDLIESGGKKILELGCNDGGLLKDFCSHNQCYGIDVSKVCLRKANDRGYITYLVDLEQGVLPFENEFFDVIICCEVLEHIVNTEQLINEINRVLKKKGVVIMSFPNINQPISFFCFLADYPPIYSARIYSPHVREITLKLMKRLLRTKGFKIISAEGTYVYPTPNIISRMLAKSFPRMGEKIIIIAEKEKDPLLLPNILWNVRDINKQSRNCSAVPDCNQLKFL